MKAEVRYKQPKRLLNPASGFLSGYTHTLNPYTGCAYACSYCYVRRMPVGLFAGQPWGSWVDVKEGAADLLRKELVRARKKGPVTIFMSSSTDPYQPAEAREGITRSLLEVMADDPPDFLFLQTRSPHVTRDADLLLRFGSRVLVSVTVETDRDDIRRAFAPSAPPIPARLKALRELTALGVPTQAAIAPLLPCTDGFGARLAEVTANVCLDTFAMGDGSGGRRTEQLRISEIHEQLGLSEWYRPEAYLHVREQLTGAFDPGRIRISRDGFLPLPAEAGAGDAPGGGPEG
ncbi:SPL family radical SAM protein [Paenibacillus lutrae]|uniref:Radical SAM protein n=1 Tax=Paenibacillus lutrae TaxID=2078573 RepID=A0A7X3FMI9_9BACL|nr:radical SAM protein [Paenibacillus lutrae]MVP02489.1 radical SAM protein [Paenibacillus lutrae]